MLINHEKKFIYIHIPKTGGISVRSIISKIPGTITANPPHGSIEFLNKKFNTKDYFKFTTVRNPFDWYKSFFSFKGSSWSHDIYTPDNKKNFNKWLNGLLDLQIDQNHLEKIEKKLVGALDMNFHLYLLKKKKIENVGWLSHLLIYSCCLNFKDLLGKKIEDICENIDKYFHVDTFIPIEKMTNIKNFLPNVFLKDYLNNIKIPHHNKSVYDKNDFFKDDKIKKKVIEKEKLAFAIYNKSLEKLSK